MSNLKLFRPLPLVGLIAVGVIMLGAFGCGGSGGGTGTGSTATTGTANPYSGDYSGEFIDQNDTIDTVSVNVGNDGTFSGIYNYPSPIPFTGTINSSGVGTITDAQGTLPIKMGPSGHTTLGGGVGTASEGVFVTLIPNPTGVFSGFSGQYAGTVHNVTLGKTGIIALSISSTGVVSGVDLFNVNGTPTLEGVAGTLTSNGHLSYVVDGVQVTGTVALSGSTISGNVSESNGDGAVLSVNQVQPN